jgi:hypothetical protein
VGHAYQYINPFFNENVIRQQQGKYRASTHQVVDYDIENAQ